MEAIVLAGGFGTRLQTVVPDLPKPMAPVGGRPFLEILLGSLAKKGFGRVLLSLGYRASQIQDYFGASFLGMKLDYVVETTPLGTGGAIRLSLSQCTEDPVFVWNGDSFLDLDVDAALRVWTQTSKPVIIAHRMEDTSRYGRLITQGNQVLGFSEKGVSGSGLINAGCYIFPRAILEDFPAHVPFSLETEFLAHGTRRLDFVFYESIGLFIDIGIPEDYRRAQVLLAGLG